MRSHDTIDLDSRCIYDVMLRDLDSDLDFGDIHIDSIVFLPDPTMADVYNVAGALLLIDLYFCLYISLEIIHVLTIGSLNVMRYGI